jgi:hypothetical protein
MNIRQLIIINAAILAALFANGCVTRSRESLSDLRIEKIYFAKYVPPAELKQYEPVNGSLSTGQKVYLVCRFGNAGATVHGEWNIAYFIDDQQVYSTIFGDFAAGQTQDPAGWWIAAEPGSHKYSCRLDPANAIAESSKDNNTMTISFDVK